MILDEAINRVERDANNSQPRPDEEPDEPRVSKLPGEIKNLELLDYHAEKLNDVFRYRDYIFFFASGERHMVNERRWKSLRNTCVVLLYVGLLFGRPAWCGSEPNAQPNCSATSGNPDGARTFYLVFPHFLDAYNVALGSWFLMLVLILYDLLLVETASSLVLISCGLFSADVLVRLFSLSGVFDLPLSPLFRFTFLILYTFAKKEIHPAACARLCEAILGCETADCIVRGFDNLSRAAAGRAFFR